MELDLSVERLVTLHHIIITISTRVWHLANLSARFLPQGITVEIVVNEACNSLGSDLHLEG